MKALVCSIFLFSGIHSYAQAIIDTNISNNKPGKIMMYCGTRKPSGPQPLFIIKEHAKQYILDSAGLSQNVLQPDCITSICVLKDQYAIDTYGTSAKNGVLIITINKARYPEAFQKMIPYLKKL